MASDMATRRLRKELIALKKNPVENIVAAPLDSNILEWHYVITGTKGSPYEGGFYHGKLKFPPEYPMKPPSVLMLTPNGRFQCARRLCLSMSDFHPESWNPVWSVSTILMGLYSFMLDTAATLGSVTSSTAQKRKLASESLEFNCKNVAFRKLFPELVELHERRKKEAVAAGGVGNTNDGGAQSSNTRSARSRGFDSGAKGPAAAERVAEGSAGVGGGAAGAFGWVVLVGLAVGLSSVVYALQAGSAWP